MAGPSLGGFLVSMIAMAPSFDPTRTQFPSSKAAAVVTLLTEVKVLSSVFHPGILRDVGWEKKEKTALRRCWWGVIFFLFAQMQGKVIFLKTNKQNFFSPLWRKKEREKTTGARLTFLFFPQGEHPSDFFCGRKKLKKNNRSEKN